jgi:type I restriction enzyme S subunit
MNWETLQLGEFLTLKRGYDLPSSQRKEGDVPIVSSSGITGRHNVAKVEGPGVVTGRYGTLGEVFFVNEDYWPLNTALYVQDFKGNDRRFSAYFLKSVLAGTTSDKAAVPGVNRNDLHARKVTVTRDRGQQSAIASTLSAYDDLIENNRRRIQLLEESARLLYREWFVRLRFPGHKHVKIIDGVPEGWEKKTYSDLFELLGGFAFKSKTYKAEGKYGIVTIKNVHDARFIPECPSRLDDAPEKMKEHCVLKMGDVLFSLTGNVGRTCIVYGENYLLNQRVAKIVGKPGISRSFVYWTFSNETTQKELGNLAYGVAQLNLSPVKLGEREFVKPTSTLLSLFTEIAEPIFEQICTLNLQVNELTKARDLLLPRLMTGEIEV